MNFQFFKPNGNGLENKNSLFANNSFTAIIGPTGSGKTSLICNIIKNRNRDEQFSHIFITSPQNMALDRTFESFHLKIKELTNFDLNTNGLRQETQVKANVNPILYFVDPLNLEPLYQLIADMNMSNKVANEYKNKAIRSMNNNDIKDVPCYNEQHRNNFVDLCYNEQQYRNTIDAPCNQMKNNAAHIYAATRFPYDKLKILFIFEDSTGSKILTNPSETSPLFKLIKMRRHFLTSCIFCMHSYKAVLAPVFRAQLTEIFLMSGLNKKVIKDVFEEMNANIFGKSEEELIDEYNEVTGTYSKDSREREKKRYNNIGYFIVPRRRVNTLKSFLQ